MEPLVTLLITYIAFLTVCTVWLIHSYEDKLKKLKSDLEYEKKAWYHEANRVEELTDLEAYWANMYDSMQKRYSALLTEYKSYMEASSEPKTE